MQSFSGVMSIYTMCYSPPKLHCTSGGNSFYSATFTSKLQAMTDLQNLTNKLVNYSQNNNQPELATLQAAWSKRHRFSSWNPVLRKKGHSANFTHRCQLCSCWYDSACDNCCLMSSVAVSWENDPDDVISQFLIGNPHFNQGMSRLIEVVLTRPPRSNKRLRWDPGQNNIFERATLNYTCTTEMLTFWMQDLYL